MSDKDFKESNVIGLDSTDSMLREVALAFVVAARKIKAICQAATIFSELSFLIL